MGSSPSGTVPGHTPPSPVSMRIVSIAGVTSSVDYQIFWSKNDVRGQRQAELQADKDEDVPQWEGLPLLRADRLMAGLLLQQRGPVEYEGYRARFGFLNRDIQE